MLRMLGIGLIVVALGACSSPAAAPVDQARARDATPLVVSAPLPADTPGRPTIVKLRLRDLDMTIVSTESGPRFVVAALDGSSVERDLGAPQLAARYPMLYELYRSAVVKAKGPYLDARLDLPRADAPLDRHR